MYICDKNFILVLFAKHHRIVFFFPFVFSTYYLGSASSQSPTSSTLIPAPSYHSQSHPTLSFRFSSSSLFFYTYISFTNLTASVSSLLKTCLVHLNLFPRVLSTIEAILTLEHNRILMFEIQIGTIFKHC